jgi:hypothetical protein
MMFALQVTFYFTLFLFDGFLAPTHFVCYEGFSAMATLFHMGTFILLYSRLVDCWNQLILYVIMATQLSVASWLLLNGACFAC